MSTGSASGASNEDWGKCFSIVVEIFYQQELELGVEQLKHGAGNFVGESCETPKLLGINIFCLNFFLHHDVLDHFAFFNVLLDDF